MDKELAIHLREMKKEDAKQVSSIEQASFAVPWSTKVLWEEAVNSRTYYLVAELQGEIVGYAGMWLIADEAQITNIAVLPKMRGKGIGNALLEELIYIAKMRGKNKMTLEVRPSNKKALCLYEKLGFKSYGRRPKYYLDNGEDAIIMWKMSL